MTSVHVHVGNDAAVLMGVSPELMFVRSFGAADVNVHLSRDHVADVSPETGIVLRIAGERADGEPCQIEALFTDAQAEDFVLMMAKTLDESRKRTSE